MLSRFVEVWFVLQFLFWGKEVRKSDGVDGFCVWGEL